MNTPPAMDKSVNEDCLDLARHRQGDSEAFGRLFVRHAPVVLAICRKELNGRGDPDDALQETFIRAFQKLNELSDCRGFRPWLYAISRFVRSELARSRRRRAIHEGAAMTQATAETPTADSTVAVAEAEDLRRLDDALNTLDDDERLAVHIYYLEHDPVAAAQSALGLGRAAFYKLLARARGSLALRMKEVALP